MATLKIITEENQIVDIPLFPYKEFSSISGTIDSVDAINNMDYMKKKFVDKEDKFISFFSTDDNIICSNGKTLRDNIEMINNSSEEICDINYISPESLDEFIELTKEGGLFYCLTNVPIVYNEKNYDVIGLLDVRPHSNGINYYAYNKMWQFLIDPDTKELTHFSSFSEFLQNRIPSDASELNIIDANDNFTNDSVEGALEELNTQCKNISQFPFIETSSIFDSFDETASEDFAKINESKINEAMIVSQSLVSAMSVASPRHTWTDGEYITDVLMNNIEERIEANKEKLDGMDENANNYVHPDTHPATIITEDSTHRFVTDEEKNKWNNMSTSSSECSVDWVNAKTQFGVVGDGVTDDTENLQAFFTYITSNSLCGYIPKGTYKTTDSIKISCSCASYSFRGSGMGTCKIVCYDKTKPVIEWQEDPNFLTSCVVNVGFYDMSIRHNQVYEKETAIGMLIPTLIQSEMRNIRFLNSAIGMKSMQLPPWGCSFDNLVFSGFKRHAIYWYDKSNTAGIPNNHFGRISVEQNEQLPDTYAIVFWSGQNTVINSLEFFHNLHGGSYINFLNGNQIIIDSLKFEDFRYDFGNKTEKILMQGSSGRIFINNFLAFDIREITNGGSNKKIILFESSAGSLEVYNHFGFVDFKDFRDKSDDPVKVYFFRNGDANDYSTTIDRMRYHVGRIPLLKEFEKQGRLCVNEYNNKRSIKKVTSDLTITDLAFNRLLVDSPEKNIVISLPVSSEVYPMDYKMNIICKNLNNHTVTLKYPQVISGVLGTKSIILTSNTITTIEYLIGAYTLTPIINSINLLNNSN